MNRKLVIKRETLAELTTDELATVAGAAPWTPVIQTLPVKQCVATTFSLQCPTEYGTCLCTPPQ